ncbi:MAG: DMT family transporter [Eubacteriales bacterium]|nr:DMT family transporter [Eubacteriales bacterium]
MDHRNVSSSRRPVYVLTLSMVIFGTIGIFRRSIPLPSDVLAFGRGILGGVFLLLAVRARGRKLQWNKISRKAFALLALTGALIGFNWILLFEAYNYTTVAVATLCYYMSPVIVMVLSPMLLKEKLSVRQAVCVVLSVTGMFLVSGVVGETGAAASGSFRGVFLGLAAAVLYASVVLLNKLITGIPPFEKTIIQLFSASVVLLPYMSIAGTLHAYALTTAESLLFLAVGIVHTGVAYAMYFGSMEHLPARTCALLSYIDPVSAVLLSAVFLREPMGVPGILGTILIIGAAVYSEM